MMFKNRNTILLAVAAAVALSLVLSSSGCDKNRIKCAVQASEKIVRVADKAPTITNELAAEGSLDAGDAEQINRLTLDVRAAAVEFGNVARSMREDTPDNREKLRAAAVQVVASLRKLDQDGVLRIKNEKARARLRTVLALAEVAAELAT